MGKEIFGSETRCCVCGGKSNVIGTMWYDNQPSVGIPARKVWWCTNCDQFICRALRDAGTVAVITVAAFWTLEENVKAIKRAQFYYKEATQESHSHLRLSPQ